MNIQLAQSSLLWGLNIVSKVVPSSSPMPILTGVLIETWKGAARLTATDLESAAQCTIPARIMQEGAAVLPLKVFSELVRKLPPHEITLSLRENEMVAITWEKAQYNLNGFRPDEFPRMMMVDRERGVEVPAKTLIEMIKSTVFAAASSEERNISLTGVLVQIKQGKLTMATCDGIRIACISRDIDYGDEECEFIVPAKVMHEVARLASGLDDTEVKVFFTENQVLFDINSVLLASRLIDGRFPNYQQIIPNHCCTSITLDSNEFFAACERAALVPREGANYIRLQFSESGVVITSAASSVGTVYEEVPGELTGEPLDISFNPRFLLDGLKVVLGKPVVFEGTGPSSIARISSPEFRDFFYLVLPLRR
ncbi:MAG: DNA polymerase III subunit beta [Bacillota bacterium]